jgi:1-deoxy-D-xylulose-5-phosphate synthase
MMIHDTAIAGLHVVFAVDRAGLVGADGETHHGAFDVGYLRTVPGMTVFAPASTEELRKTLHHAVYQVKGPVAIRYPRGGNDGYVDCILENCVLEQGTQVTLVTYGTMIAEAMSAREKLEKEGISVEVVKLWQLAPLDTSLVAESVQKTGRLIVLEECVSSGCVGQELVSSLAQQGVLPPVVRLMNLGGGFVTHGKVSQLRHAWHIDSEAVYETIKELVYVEKGTT